MRLVHIRNSVGGGGGQLRLAGCGTLACSVVSVVTESQSSLGDKICCLSYDYICVQN